MTRSHEDYCLGHLLQAGIAYYRATGSRRLLDAGVRFADYVVDNFGPAKRPFLTGHPELEMAMAELVPHHRPNQISRFHPLPAQRRRKGAFEAQRFQRPSYMFSGKPFTSRTEFEGHAVRALYAVSGATDFFTEAGDPAYKKTLDLLWTDLTMRKMYITGGAGSRAGGESFGDALRTAQRTSLCRDLRRHRQRHVEFPHAHPQRRRPLCRCFGARPLQRRQLRPVPLRNALLLPQSPGIQWREITQYLV